jgi:hypothetical protein
MPIEEGLFNSFETWSAGNNDSEDCSNHNCAEDRD